MNVVHRIIDQCSNFWESVHRIVNEQTIDSSHYTVVQEMRISSRTSSVCPVVSGVAISFQDCLFGLVSSQSGDVAISIENASMKYPVKHSQGGLRENGPVPVLLPRTAAAAPAVISKIQAISLLWTPNQIS